MPGALGGTSSELAPLLTESGAGLAIQAEAAPIAGKSPLRKWWALFVFCMLGVVQNINWVVFSTIVDDVHQYYRISDDQINRLIELAQLCFIPGVFIFSPMSDRFGLKVAFVGSCAVVFGGALCRWLGPDPGGAGWRDPYAWLLVGQGLNGLAGPLTMNAPPQLAAIWFPPDQRVTATAIGWSSQAVGMAAGYYIAPAVATTYDRTPALMLRLAQLSGGLFVLSLSLPGAPAQPVSRSAGTERVGFFGAARSIWSPSFVALGLSWSLAMGATTSSSALTDIFLDGRFTDAVIGQIAATASLVGLAGSLVLPGAVGALGLQRHMKTLVVISMWFGVLGAAVFTIQVYYQHDSPAWAIGLAQGVVAFATGALSPMALELAAEITFPASEETAAAYMTLLSMLFNVGLMEVANAVVGKNPCTGAGEAWRPALNLTDAVGAFGPGGAVESAAGCSGLCSNTTSCKFFTWWGEAGRCSLSGAGALLATANNATQAGPVGCDLDHSTDGGRVTNLGYIAVMGFCALLLIPVKSGNRRMALDCANEGTGKELRGAEVLIDE